MKIQGAVLEEIGRDRPYAAQQPISISELDLDEPGSTELLVRMEAAEDYMVPREVLRRFRRGQLRLPPGGPGSLGRARLASAAKGRLIYERILERISERVFDVPTAARATRRVPCSACGLSKRHLFDAAARAGGYDVVATGHNLDDEAAVLLGNTLRWDVDYLSRQLPVLAAGAGFPRKVKPLVRLTEARMEALAPALMATAQDVMAASKASPMLARARAKGRR